MYLWKQGFFITNAEQTQRLAQHHVEERLIILIRDFAAVNSFTSIFIQLGREKPTNKKVATSILKIWLLKKYCNCSFARLIRSCSRLLSLKHSNPKMSRIPEHKQGLKKLKYQLFSLLLWASSLSAQADRCTSSQCTYGQNYTKRGQYVKQRP